VKRACHETTLPATPRWRESGLTLIELLVAMAVVSVVLSAAYGWVWSVGSLARTQDDRAQARTVVAAAARSVADDLRASVGVAVPPAGRDPSRSLLLVHHHVDTSPEQVLVVWDPARQVLWRNTSSTYIADRISLVRLVCLLADGLQVPSGSMGADDWGRVVAVQATFISTVGSASAGATVCVGLGSS
jgi:prepilin-type N-terminal cleavage/methylation domain-containing protein